MEYTLLKDFVSELEAIGLLFLPSKDYNWMFVIFAILLLTAVASILSSLLIRFAAHRLERTKTEWDDILLLAMRKPVKLIIWVVGISLAANTLVSEANEDILSLVKPLRDIAIVWAIAWTVVRFIARGSEYYVSSRRQKGQSYDITTIHAVTKLLKISIIVSAGLIALQTLGVSVSGVLAFGGIGGLAVGFAAKDMLANFFGALIIYFDKPFKVGDWIRSPDQNIEGIVEEIGWRMTTIRTFDKRPLYVPNAVFTTISVENPSRMSHRRIYETIGIRYDDIGVMKAITDDVRTMLNEHHEIDESQTLIVFFDAFNSSSCDFFVYTFTHTTDWIKFHAVKQDVLLKIAAIIDAHGAEIAYPTQVEYQVEKLIEDGGEAA
ncbi:MAG: mechanosensitive ion channel family protein [Rickettsiales bacterium]|nr:mechanosensitive ion channel family protein [Rickettsiales bacterium]